ncbi:uncharacterized protein B0J16DRAFT_379650 [Fusarium flagelliforme]|uniref:uncharacterized protein n=1 Tax=Fusarium flagelliforme TaxID=2675880 RepID=UPI001E8D18DF|nr:uncharacterized protein B0J16DRAFT_379650 [Fusarium flagelliforme]KAH7191761.1 hypothetical protein B0J16DRAFT_379650 [Fusarium flagelliforme]
MRAHFIPGAALAFLGQLAAAEDSNFGTHVPCSDCPPGVGPAPVPITVQFQELEHCSMTTTHESTGYACDEAKGTFVSTSIPAACTDGTYTTTLVTEIDQIITVEYSRTTDSRSWRVEDGYPASTPAIVVDVVEYIYTVPFSQLGKHGVSDYEGSGLCPADVCGINDLREEFQHVTIKECHNGNCVVYGAVRNCEPKYSTTTKVFNGDSRVYTKGISGYHTQLQRPDVTPLPCLPSAPVGCEVIEAAYVTVVHEEFVTLSAVYTVPAAGGSYGGGYYGGGYGGGFINGPGDHQAPCPTCQPRPIGTCETCVPPPGWTVIVTVINNPTEGPSTVTLTVPTTVTEPTTVVVPTTVVANPTGADVPTDIPISTDDSGNPLFPPTVTDGSDATDPPTSEPTSGALSCPASDRSVFLTGARSTFQIQCSSGLSGVEINAKRDEIAARNALLSRDIGNSGSFEGCIELCDNTEDCVAAAYYPDSGRCKGFSSVDGSTAEENVWAANLIAKGPGFSTTSAEATSADVTSSQPTAQPSSDPDPDTEDASVERRSELVPKRFVSDENLNAGGVQRRAGRISNANLDKAAKKSKRTINIQL